MPPIKNGRFAYPVAACEANGGICHKHKTPCGTCDIARKYIYNKIIASFGEACPSKNEDGTCDVFLRECKAFECFIATRVADARIKECFPD
jgi:hypothetical protein